MNSADSADWGARGGGALGIELPVELREWEAAGEYLTVGAHGQRLFARSVGRRDAAPEATLLLLHGYPESSQLYAQSLAALAERFDRIVLFDFLGFGLSDKPVDNSYSLFEQADLALEVWHQLGVTGGHIVGHDMGDSVVTELLARQTRGLLPGWFEAGFVSVTFTNGNMVMELAKLRVGQQLLRTPYVGALLSRRSSFGTFANQIRSASGSGLLPEREIELMWAATGHNDGQRVQHKIIRYLDERDRFQNTRWLPAVAATDAPIHVCWGAADNVAPIAVAQHLKAKVNPAAHLSLIPGVGHFLQQEAPEEWVAAAMAFWTRIS